MHTRRSMGAEQLAEDSAAVLRGEYFKPLIMLGVGLVLAAIGSLMTSEGLTGAAFYIIGFVIGLSVSVVLAFIGLTITSYLISLDAGPITLVFLRLAGIFAVMIPVSSLLPLGGLLWGISMLLILSGLVAMMFDFELYEAAIAVIIMIVVNFVATMLLVSMFAD